jgi:hypothetical protein
LAASFIHRSPQARRSRQRSSLVAREQLPPKVQPKPHLEDLKKLLMASCQPGSANLHLAQAKCKLFPDKDPLSIYQEYGMEGGRE